MLDRKDQQQLERNIEQRSTALHRTISVMIATTGLILASTAFNNAYSNVVAYAAIFLCFFYSYILLRDSFVFTRSARRLIRQAKSNEVEFTEDMEAFLENVGKKS